MQRVTPPWGCALKPGVFVGLTPHGSSVVRRKSTGTYYTYLPLGSLTKIDTVQVLVSRNGKYWHT